MNSRAYLLNWFFAALAAFAVIGSAFYVESTYLEQLRQKRVLETRARISEAGASIESVIRSNLASLQGLAAYLSIKPDISQADFAETANLFLSNNDMVNTVYRISSSFQYTHRYPDAINLDLLDSFIEVDSQDFELARQAVETGKIFVSGPVTESNGVDFLHVWLPLQGSGRQHRTALLFFPIALNPLYETSGLGQVSRDIDIAVRTIRNGKPASVFFGSPSLFSVSDITYSFSLPGAQWQIVAGIREDSFVEKSSRLWIELAAGVLIGIIFLILWLRLKELKSVSLIENQQLMLDQAQRVGRIGNWSWNISKGDIFWSDEAYRLFGLEKGDPSLTKNGYMQYVHDDDRQTVEQSIDEAMKRGGRYQADFRLMRADFDLRWIHSEGFVELSTDRRPVRVFGTFQDVTSSRKIERELKQREAQLSAITDAAQSLIMITRADDGKVLFCNPSSKRMLGIEPEELIGRSIVELYPSPKDREEVLERVEKDKHLSNFSLRLRRVDSGEISTFLIGLQLIRFQNEDCFVVDMVDITSMLEVQSALAESEEKFRLFAENVPGFFWLSDPESGQVEFLSPGYRQVTGLSPQDALTGQEPLFSNVVVEDKALVDQLSTVSRQPLQVEFRIQFPDGSVKWVRSLSFATYDDQGRVKNLAGFGEDITAAYLSNQRIKLAASVFESTAEAIVVTDAQNCIVSVNEAFSRITGYQAEEVLGEKPSILSSGKQSDEFYKVMWASLQSTGNWQGEVWNRKKNGELYVEWLSITALRNRYHEVENYVAVFSDITDRKEKEELIRYQANYDALTGLPNRVLFNDRLTQAITSARRYPKDRGALMFIDLDHFKEVNDTLGHEAGDSLLKMVAERLKKYTRESDTVARLGGDEFTVMLPSIVSVDDVGKVAEKIIESLSKTFDLNGKAAHISASVGVTIFPDDGEELTRVLQNADQAMYAAKSAGRHTYRFFTPLMQQEAERRQLLQNDLRSALERKEFELHYQPVVDQKGRAVKVEALVRWNHPQQGRVPPDQFISLAEETGLIIPLGGWVFNQAVAEISKLRKTYPELGVAINLSSKQVGTDEAHVEHFIDIVQQYNLPANFVTLEITESLFLDPGGESVEKLNRLREQGFEIAIDDFGTGYSSLSYLKQLPLTTIKIDKSFVSDLDKDQGDRVLVDAILSIAQSMQLNVIAEGVETDAQSDYLVKGGAQMQQGWLHGKPMPLPVLSQWLEENYK